MEGRKGEILRGKDGRIVSLFMEYCREGFVYIDNKKIVASNNRAMRLLDLEKNQNNPEELIGKEKFLELIANGITNILINNRLIEIRMFSIHKEEYLLILQDRSSEENLRFELNNMRTVLSEMTNVLETYNDNTIYVCDAKGNTLWAGRDVAENCGVSKDYLLSHNVYELEKEGVFYPSVSVKVLESGKTEAITQITGTGNTGISIGVPFYDDNTRDLKYIISITSDMTAAMQLGGLLAQMHNTNEQTKPQIDDLIGCSNYAQGMIKRIENIAKTNALVWIYGESGSGKSTIARAIHKLSRMRDAVFYEFDCSETEHQDKELFGGGKTEGIINKISRGSLYISNIQEMTLSCQRRLLYYLNNSDEKIFFRIIISSDNHLEEAVENKKFLKKLYNKIETIYLKTLPLRNRREDIPLFIKYFLGLNYDKYELKKSFSRNAMEILNEYEYPGNITELGKIVEMSVVMSSTSLIRADELPTHVIGEILIEKNDEREYSLPQAVAKLEAHMIRKELERGTEEMAAKRLGINQSTISRKIKKYGINVLKK